MRAILVIVLCFGFGASAFAASPEKVMDKADERCQRAVTMWVDANWGRRKNGAAKDLNETHAEFNARGWDVVSVESYIENSDLEGFFVTYTRKHAPRCIKE